MRNYQKPKAREYFYTENGVVKMFLYCSHCGSGPYKEHDSKIQKLGSVQTPVNYCQTCASIKSIHAHDIGTLQSTMRTVQRQQDAAVPAEKKTKESIELDELINVLEPDSGEKTTVFIARGKDGILFCSESEDPEELILAINNGKIKQSGMSKSSLPMQIVYEKIVSSVDCADFVNRVRKLTKEKKNELITAYQEVQEKT